MVQSACLGDSESELEQSPLISNKLAILTMCLIHHRGRVVSLFVSCIVVFNMGVGMTAEYTAIGDLFEYVLEAPRVPIVVLIGCVTMLYTAWGGLYVSIVTDLWQVRFRCRLALFFRRLKDFNWLRHHSHHGVGRVTRVVSIVTDLWQVRFGW